MALVPPLLIALVASGGTQTPTTTPARPEIAPVRVSAPPVIDGVLEDEAWRDASLSLSEWLTYNPMNGDRIPQTTQVRAAYDDRNIYFAFHCVDLEPARVRSTLSRRDNMWNDDWVGLSLDSVGNGQSSYDLFVNPQGVQNDILTTPSAGENTAPDFVWQSAGRRTAEGYDVEMRLPLTSFRFKAGSDVKMGILFWRRVSRLGMSVSWPEVPAGKSFIERHALMTLQNLKQPLTLEVIPSATWSVRQTRETPDAFGSVDSDPDAGISAKYGITSEITVEGTVNPDFSQVESDAFQVEVNQRFPVFYSEKRPFFMEGMGTFALAGTGGDSNMRTAVHTRVIEDPLWGAKSSGTAGKASFAVLAAGDEAPGQQALGEPVNPFLDERKKYFVGRGQWSLGRASYAGAIFTDTEFGSGFNRVAGTDVSLKRGDHNANASFLASKSRSDDGLQETDGLAGQATYAYETKPFVFVDAGRALRHRLPDGHGVPEPDRRHPGLELPGAELLPRHEEAEVAEARGALPVRQLRQGPHPGRQQVPGAAGHPAAHDAAGLLPPRLRLGPRAVGGRGVPDAAAARLRRRAGLPLAERLHAGPLRALGLLRRGRSVPGQREGPDPSKSACSRARASTSRSPGTAWCSTARATGRTSTRSTS